MSADGSHDDECIYRPSILDKCREAISQCLEEQRQRRFGVEAASIAVDHAGLFHPGVDELFMHAQNWNALTGHQRTKLSDAADELIFRLEGIYFDLMRVCELLDDYPSLSAFFPQLSASMAALYCCLEADDAYDGAKHIVKACEHSYDTFADEAEFVELLTPVLARFEQGG